MKPPIHFNDARHNGCAEGTCSACAADSAQFNDLFKAASPGTAVPKSYANAPRLQILRVEPGVLDRIGLEDIERLGRWARAVLEHFGTIWLTWSERHPLNPQVFEAIKSAAVLGSRFVERLPEGTRETETGMPDVTLEGALFLPDPRELADWHIVEWKE